MIKIYIIIVGESPYKEGIMYTSCAITSQGKWIAGAVSCLSKDLALERCKLMTIKKAKEMLSNTYLIEIHRDYDDDVRKALDLAFANLP